MTDRSGIFTLVSAAVLAGGMVLGGWVLGNGLTRAQEANRSVTVRGLAERDVTADLATWTITTTSIGYDLASLQASADAQGEAAIAFLKARGFSDSDFEAGEIGMSQYIDNSGRANITIRRKIRLRTTEVMKARAAYAAQADLMRKGVVFDSDGGGIIYSFTGLNGVKPSMIAEATKDARKGAEQFARDSGASVGGIKTATQGYFSIIPRDGDNYASPASASPFQKVRVVTTIDFYLR